MKIIIALNKIDKNDLTLAFDVVLCSESDFTAYNNEEKLIADVVPLDFDETPLSRYEGNAALFNGKAAQRQKFFDTVLDPAYEELLLKPLPGDRFCNIQLLTDNEDVTNGFLLTPFISPSNIQLLWTTYDKTAVDDEEDIVSELQVKYESIHQAIDSRLPEIRKLIASTRSIPLAPTVQPQQEVTVQPQQEVKEEVPTPIPTLDKYNLAQNYWNDYDNYTKNMEQRLRFVLQELKDIYSYEKDFYIKYHAMDYATKAMEYREVFTYSLNKLIFKALKEELCTAATITSLIEEYAVNRFDKVIFTGYLTEASRHQKSAEAFQARKRVESNGQGRAAGSVGEPTHAEAGLVPPSSADEQSSLGKRKNPS